MEFPLNIKISSLEIPSHLIFEILAYTIGFRYFVYLRSKAEDKISTDDRTIILIAAAAGAFLFSRLVGAFENPEIFDLEKANINTFYGNKTILGALLGGLLSVEICKKIIKVKYSSGDLMTYPLILAMIIGRIGCFLAGLEDGTYGIETTLAWGMDLGDHVYRHPTNLYEILFLILMWLSLFLLEKKYELTEGSRFKLFLCSYFIFRFFIEFIKPSYRIALGISSIQIASLIGIIYYYKLFLYPRSLISKPANA